jgi:pimeloyl-ACP methyl ester carboxylesterase
MTDTNAPVLFIHGLWLHASSWGPWIERFERAGYRGTAPTWPGEQVTVAASRARPDLAAGFGIDEVTDHFRTLVRAMPAAPIVVGHSFGGLIAQKLLATGHAAAAVAIDAAQIKGVLPLPASALRATFPVFRSPGNRKRAVSLTADQFRYAFGNTLEPEESDALFERWSIPAPGRPLFQAAAANFVGQSPAKVDTRAATRGPLLLVAGGRDHTVPRVITLATAKLYRGSPAVTDLQEFSDRGHSLTMDSGWTEVADAALTWLDKQGL